MTIGIGFKCLDGIVIATDTQYTKGVYKGAGPKIFHVERDNFAVLIGGAGNVGFMKRAVEQIDSYLHGDMDIANIKDRIERALLDFRTRNVYPIPGYRQDEYTFQLLVGIGTKAGGYGLYSSTEGTLSPVSEHGSAHATIGYGFSVADYALHLLVGNTNPNVETAKILATIAVKAAKDWVEYCGGKTHVYTIQNDKSGFMIHSAITAEIDAAETSSEDLFSTLTYVLDCLDPSTHLDDESIRAMTDVLRDQIVKYRNKESIRRERIKRIRERDETATRRLEDQESEKRDSQSLE